MMHLFILVLFIPEESLIHFPHSDFYFIVCTEEFLFTWENT